MIRILDARNVVNLGIILADITEEIVWIFPANLDLSDLY